MKRLIVWGCDWGLGWTWLSQEKTERAKKDTEMKKIFSQRRLTYSRLKLTLSQWYQSKIWNISLKKTQVRNLERNKQPLSYNEERGVMVDEDWWPLYLWQLLTFIPLSEVNDLLLRGAYIRGLGPRDPTACLLNLCVAALAVLSFARKNSLPLSHTSLILFHPATEKWI